MEGEKRLNRPRPPSGYRLSEIIGRRHQKEEVYVIISYFHLFKKRLHLIRKDIFSFSAVLVVTLFSLTLPALSQVSYQFQENKGQWDSIVQFRSRIPGGSVFLRKGGFTYSLLDQKDLVAMDNYVHGSAAHHGPSGDSSFVIGPGRRSGGGDTGEEVPGFSPPVDRIHAFAYRMDFIGYNPDVRLIPDHPYDTRYNYLIGNDSSRWGRNVKEYGGVTYKELYPKIDARVYAVSAGLKYDLIAYPGSDPEHTVRLRYDGPEKLYLKNGHLHVVTPFGEVIEAAPYAYQTINGDKTEVPCRYRLQGKEISFRISGRYDPDYPLIIDPRLIFASFSGSATDNWGYTATYDAAGNFYMGGIVFGTGYPVTTGAYQIDFQGGSPGSSEGGFDISLSKFSADGTKLIYATYLGGSGNEQPQSLIVDKNGNLIISGRTSNWSTYPRKGAEGGQVGPCGGAWDVILTELNADGSDVIGSLTIGGKGADGANIADKYTNVNGKWTTSLRRFYGDDARSEVNIDGAGNILLVGCTQSGDFPVRPNAGAVFQQQLGGDQDAFVLKASADLSQVVWSSFLGGAANDAAYVITFSPNGNLYVAGGTESSNFPGNKTNVKQASYAGLVDGFIAEIRDDGSQVVRATYLGTGQADQIYGIQTDTAGNIYVGGTTEGVWEVTDNGKYAGINLNGKQFLAKLKPDLSAYVYSTVFGSTNSQPASLPNISPTAFLVDRCQNVYMAGWGGDVADRYMNAGTNNMPTVNALNPRPPDGRDFYFFVLKKDAERILFASTYGQNGGFTDHVDGGTSRFDPTGVIYEAICGNCGGGATFPTGPPGVYSRQNRSGAPGSNQPGCNEIALKIAFDLDGVRGGVASLDRRHIYCNNEQVTFIDTLYGRSANSWTWSIYNTWDSAKLDLAHRVVTAVQDASMPTPYQYDFAFASAGYYTVQMVKYRQGDCIEYDTSYLRLKIGDNPASLKVKVHKLRPCDSYRYEFVNNSLNAQDLPFSDTAFSWNFGDGTPPVIAGKDTVLTHQFPGEGNYTITLTLQDTANFCNVPLDTSVVISVSNHLRAVIQAPDTLCIPDTYLLGNASQGGTNFVWAITTPAGVTDSFHIDDLSQLPYNFDSPGNYRVELFAQDTVCGTEDYAVDTVYTYPRPSAGFTFSPDNATNQVITFTNTSVSNFGNQDDELHYIWYFGDGITSTEKNPQHLFTQTETYLVQLVAYNNAGCADTASMEVSETIIPKLDVPNAFTPNGDGRNDFFGPRAFGVTEIDFKVYNRWGQLVYQSSDPQVAYMQNKGWDGTFRNQPQPMDVYAYTLHVVFNDGTKATKQGSVTLVR